MATLSDYYKQAGQSTGGGGGGSWWHHIGLSELGSQIKGIVPGLAHLVGSLAPGGTPAGEAFSQAGRGFANSVLQTGGRILTAIPEAVTLGKSNFGDAELTKASKFLAGSNPQMQQEFANQVGWKAYAKNGILPSAVQDIGNVALGAGQVAKVARLGEVGAAANAGITAAEAGKAGFGAEDVARAAESVPGVNARMLSRVPVVRGLSTEAMDYSQIPSKLREAALAQTKNVGEGLDEGTVAKRAATIERLNQVSHPYRAVFGDVIRPLGRAAQETLAPATEAANAAPQEMAVSDLAKLTGNPLRYDVTPLAEDIKANGVQEPLVVQRHPDGSLTMPEGSHRLAAAAQAGLDKVPVKIEDAPDQLGGLESMLPGAKAAQTAQESPAEAPLAGGTPPRVGPAEKAIQALHETPVPEWARSLAGRLPEKAQQGLGRIEGRVQAHEVASVDREQRRFVQSARRTLVHDPNGPVQASIKAAKMLRGRTLEDGTRIDAETALGMVGGELTARLEGRAGMAQLLKDHLPEEQHAAVDEAMRLHDRIPTNLMSQQLETAITKAQGKWNEIDPQRMAALLGSSKGERGLENVGRETPIPSKGQTGRMKQLTRDQRDLVKLGKARDRELVQSQRKLIDMTTKIKRLGAEGERIGELRDAQTELLDGLAERGFPLEDISNMTPSEIANALPKVPGETLHQSMKRALEMGKALQKAAALDERQTQIVKNLANVRKGKDDLITAMNTGKLTKAAAYDRRSGVLANRATKLMEDINTPNAARAPVAYKPMMEGLSDLAKIGREDSTMAEALRDVAPTFSAVVAKAKENGFEPTQVASLTERNVRKMLFDPVKLSEKNREGKTILSGQRKTRRGNQSRQHTIEALAAAHVDAVLEPAANEVISVMEKHIARDIPEGWGEAEMTKAGYIPWDPERSFILTGKHDTGNNYGPGPTKMVPKAVGTAMKHMSGDYSHSIWGITKPVTNAWRAAVLTWTPRWYVNNVLGNVALATTGGVRLDDWLAAYVAMRKGSEVPVHTDEAVNWLMTKRRRSYLPEQVAPEGTTGVGGMSLYSDLQNEPKLMGEAEGTGAFNRGSVKNTYGAVRQNGQGRVQAFKAAYTEASRRMQRANEVVDDLARVAVYLSGKRRGMNPEQALTAAHTALVDYQDLSPFERQVVRSIVPFYSWQKGMLKVVSKFPVDHPVAAAVGLQIGKLNNDLFNPDVPDAYKQIIGGVQTRGLNPFQDAVDLMTPQGLVQGLNPFMDIAIRNAYGAPDGGFTTNERVDQFGNAVPDTSPLKDLLNVATGTPQYTAGTGIAGIGTYKNQKTGLRALGSFVGAPTYTQADIDRFKARMQKNGTAVQKFNAKRG